MSLVRTFKIDDLYGVPDRAVRDFIDKAERELGIVRVSMIHVMSKTSPLLTVVVTKLDDVILNPS